MRRLALLVVFGLLLWACRAGGSSSTTVAPSTTPPASATSAASTTTTSRVPVWPEVLVSNDEGVFSIASAGAVTQLVKGRVAYAVDDTRSGLLFQVERGRSSAWMGDGSPVKDTRVWWVPQGAGGAQALLAPTADSNLDLSLVDAVIVDDRSFVLYVQHDSTMDPEYGPHGWVDSLRAFDLDTREVSELFTFPAWEHSYEFSTGGGLILMGVADVVGSSCYFAEQTLSTAVSVPVVPEQEGCGDRESCQWRCVAFSPDASMVGFIGVDSSSGGAVPSVRVVDTNSGEVVVALPVSDFRLDVGDGYLDLGDGYLLVNYESEPSMVVSLADPVLRRDVPVAGTARFVTAPVELGGLVVSPAGVGGDAPTTLPNVLRGDGVATVSFGTPAEQALPVLVDLLGAPQVDRTEGAQDCYGSVAAVRFLTWDSLGLRLVFTDWDGEWVDPTAIPLQLADWEIIGPGVKTEEGIGWGSTVEELVTAFPQVLFGINEYAPVFFVELPSGWIMGGFDWPYDEFVRALQSALNENGAGLSVTGDWDGPTNAALFDFIERRGLDGSESVLSALGLPASEVRLGWIHAGAGPLCD